MHRGSPHLCIGPGHLGPLENLTGAVDETAASSKQSSLEELGLERDTNTQNCHLETNVTSDSPLPEGRGQCGPALYYSEPLCKTGRPNAHLEMRGHGRPVPGNLVLLRPHEEGLVTGARAELAGVQQQS